MIPQQYSYLFGAFRLDALDKVLWHDEQVVALTPKAIDTLVALVERHGRLVTKDELLALVWPDAFVEENNLAQNVSALRRVLGEGTEGSKFIETVPKRGYRFVAPVTEQSHPRTAITEAPTEPLVQSIPLEVVSEASAHKRRLPARWVLVLLPTVALAFVTVFGIRDRGRVAVEAPARLGALADGPRARVTRIAVLPFINLGSAEDAYFVAGMTEEVTSRLAGLRTVAVPSSTTVNQYERRGKSLTQIGSDLNVDYIVEGAVRWASADDSPRVRITPKLVRVIDDTTVWTHQYDASIADLFKIQAEIAYQITGALQVALDGRERLAVEARPTTDTDAYLAYLRGMASYQQGSSDTANLVVARAELEQAVARDPRFALAWSWLGRVSSLQFRTGAVRTQETRELARRAARTAIDLNPGLPEVHLGMAQVLIVEREYDAALREIQIARVGLPNAPELLQIEAQIEQRQGRWRESLASYLRAFELDPASTADSIVVHYAHRRQYAEARRFIGVAKAAQRTAVVVPEAFVYFSERGEVGAARRILQAALDTRSPADGRVRGLLAQLEWFDGRYQRALAVISGMDAAGGWLPANFRFPASLAAGDVYESMGRSEAAARSYAAAWAESHRRQLAETPDYQTEAALALAAAGLNRAADAVAHAERAVELLPISKDAVEGPLYVYLKARVQARVGNHAAAFATLDELFSVPGFYNEHWVLRDPSFASLRRHSSFSAAVARWSRQKGEVLLGKASPAGNE